MRTHPKKKLEMIVEATVLPRVIAEVERLGATGYTVLPALAGKGHAAAWQEGQVSGALHMVMVVVICGERRAAAIAEAVHALLGDYMGVIAIGDVGVLRDEHF